ncbi:FMR1-interacting protein NUFIP1-like [Clytia hemisphaerica]|uniref:C2H2-type domain-containing protein n=1 Tax=Clytia hemisphaerica TaxID=252671 RepID=A0A7M5XI16_9CNID
MDFPSYNQPPPPPPPSQHQHQQQPNPYYQPPPVPNTGYGYEFNQINYSGPPPQGNYNAYQQPPQYNQQYNQQNQQYGHTQYQHRQQYNNRTNNHNNSNDQRQRQQQQTGQGSVRCEPCERNFNSQDALFKHQKQHVKCEAEGCSYTASSKAVKLHFIQTHEEGKFRIVLTTPEEIKKWREERRKNWPSRSKVEQKKQHQSENKSQGIAIETKEFAYRDRPERKRGNQGVREKTNSKKQRTDVNNNNNEMKKDGTTNATGGLSLLQSYGDDDEEMVENEADKVETSKNNTELSGNALLEEGELPATDGGETDVNNKQRGSKQRDNRRNRKHNGRDGKKNQNAKRQQKHEPPKRTSLLEMLLAKEIRHERNVILQCVRYIVQKNFFQNQDQESGEGIESGCTKEAIATR